MLVYYLLLYIPTAVIFRNSNQSVQQLRRERDSLWLLQFAVCSPFVSVKIDGLRNFFVTNDIVNFDSLWDILNLALKDAVSVALAHEEKPVRCGREFIWVETALNEWEPMELKCSEF